MNLYNDNIVIAQRIESLRETCQSAKTQKLTGMPGAHNHTDLSDYAVRVDELLMLASKKREELIRVRQEVEECIESLSEEAESALIFYRYIMLMSWEDISKKMGYSIRHVIRLHGEALYNLKISQKKH